MKREPLASFEIERKYEVDGEAVLPTVEQFAHAGFRVIEQAHHELVATYYDTPQRDLAQRRLALRNRAGGKDAGWHLKEKSPQGAHELLWPESATMPEALLREVRARIGGAAAQLTPLVELHTSRMVTVLRHDGGLGEVELADDRVRALEVDAGVRRAWREWEAELLGLSDESALDVLEPLLRSCGAAPSLSVAKVARGSGQLVAVARARGASAAEIDALERLDRTDQEAARKLDA